jgi:hypothetical protein
LNNLDILIAACDDHVNRRHMVANKLQPLPVSSTPRS